MVMQNTYCKQFAIIFFYNLRYCIFNYFNIFYKDFSSFASNDCQKYVRIFYKNTSIIHGCYFIKIYIDGQNEIVLPILHSINQYFSFQISIHKKKNQLSLVLMKPIDNFLIMAGTTRLELATSCVTGKRSNQTELRPHLLS